jgi:hypothetical protein
MVDEFDEKLRKTVKDGYDSPPAKRAQEIAAQYEKAGKKVPESLVARLEKALKEQTNGNGNGNGNGSPQVKVEDFDEDSLLGLANGGGENGLLSTTDPKEEGVSYADKVKEEH